MVVAADAGVVEEDSVGVFTSMVEASDNKDDDGSDGGVILASMVDSLSVVVVEACIVDMAWDGGAKERAEIKPAVRTKLLAC